jgi:hypothetical protein
MVAYRRPVTKPLDGRAEQLAGARQQLGQAGRHPAPRRPAAGGRASTGRASTANAAFARGRGLPWASSATNRTPATTAGCLPALTAWRGTELGRRKKRSTRSPSTPAADHTAPVLRCDGRSLRSAVLTTGAVCELDTNSGSRPSFVQQPVQQPTRPIPPRGAPNTLPSGRFELACAP